MIRRLNHWLHAFRRSSADLVTGPQALAFLPAALLASFWAGGEAALMIAAVLIPALLVLAGIAERRRRNGMHGTRAGPAVASDQALEEALDGVILKVRDQGGLAVCLMVELENLAAVRNAQGSGAAATAADHAILRLRANLRRRDRVCFLGHGRFGIVLAPVKSMTADAVLQLARRLQDELQMPAGAAGHGPGFSTCIGISFAGQKGRETGADLASAAARALAEARGCAPSAIRVYRAKTGRPGAGPHPLRMQDEVTRALENGEITAWFQPQLCNDTGQVSGFETLARWRHPQRGVIPPAGFLPCLESADLTGRLLAIMLRQGLEALGKWRAQGFDIPAVGINFSPGDLHDPALADAVAWELDRHDLPARCLNAEILETVVSVSPDDEVARNIRRLSDLGCSIDLDDFGTGHASISSLKRFRIHRLKIDRSFINKIDRDQAQQRMVAAILTMAEQLELDTLAEGVETAGEHAHLAQLGCGHVQGYGIARPMPFDQTVTWLRDHREKLARPPDIRSGTH